MATAANGSKGASERTGRRLKIPLSVKFGAATMTLVALLLLLSAALSLWTAYSGAERTALAIQEEKAEALANRVEGFMTGLEAQLAWTAQPDWKAGGIEQQRADFARMMRQFPAITDLFYVDSRGGEQLKVSRLAPDSIGSLTSHANEPSFQETVKARNWFGPVYVRNGAVLAGTVGIMHADGGVTLAELDLGFLADFVKAASGSGLDAFIVDTAGRLIAHPDRNPAAGNNDLSAVPQVAAAIAANGTGATADAVMEEAPALAAFADVPRLGWKAIVETPATEALSPFRSLLWQTALLSALGLLGAAVVGVWLARRVAAPIGRLQTGAERLGEGDLTQRVAIRNRDEIGTLAEKFNTMASRLQQSQKGLADKADERAHGLDVALQQQTLTAGVLKAIGQSGQDLETVLDTLVGSAVELCEAARGAVWLMRDGELRLAAQAGYPDDWIGIARDTALPLAPDAETPHGLSAWLGQPVTVEDLPGDQRFAHGVAPGYAGDRAGLAVPLKRDGTVEGVIWLSHQDAAPFSDRQAGLVQGFADQALIAVENARLAGNVDARDRKLAEMRAEQALLAGIASVASQSPADARPVLDSIVETATRLAGAESAAYLCLFDGTSLKLQAHHGLPPVAASQLDAIAPDSGFAAARAFGAGTAVAIAKAGEDDHVVLTGAKSAVAAPLMRDGAAIGVLAVERMEAGELPERQVELLRALCDQAVIALASARLSADLQARNGELSISLERRKVADQLALAIAASSFDLEALSEALGRSGPALCGADSIQLFRRHGDVYRLVGDGSELAPGRGSLVGRVAEEGSTVQILDVWDDPDYALKDASVRSMLGLPLAAGGKVVGVLSLARQHVAPFGDAEVAVAAAFAELAAIAIEKANLLDEARLRSGEMADALRQKSASSGTLEIVGRTTFDLEDVLKRMASTAADVCRAQGARVLRRVGGSYQVMAGYASDGEDQADAQVTLDGNVHGILARMEATGIPVQFEAVAADPVSENLATDPGGFGAALAVPMLRDGTVVGAVLLGRHETTPFTQGEVELVQSLADQAAIAFETTDLQDRLKSTAWELNEALAHKQAASRVATLGVGSAPDPQPVFDAVVQDAAALCGADTAVLAWLGDDALHRLAMSGKDDPSIAEWAAGRVSREGHLVHVADLAAEPDLAGQDETSSGALLAVPLIDKGRVVGMLLIARASAGAFSERQIELAETLAAQAAVAIESAMLFTDLGTRTAELGDALHRERATADALSERDGQLAETEAARAALATESATLSADLGTRTAELGDALERERTTADALSEREGELAATEAARAALATEAATLSADLGTRTTELGDALQRERATADALSERQAELAETEAARAALATESATLFANLGARTSELDDALQRERATADALSEQQAELAETEAARAALATENEALSGNLGTRTAELGDALQRERAVAETGKTISRPGFDVEALLGAMAASAGRLGGADTAAIYLRDGEVYRLSAEAGMTGELRAAEAVTPYAVSTDTWVGRAAMEKTVVHVPDVAAGHASRRHGAAAALCVPLLRQGVAVGVFQLTRNMPGPFGERQVELIRTFADQAVVAIENTGLAGQVDVLTGELSAARQEQEATADIARIVGGSAVDLNSLLQTLISSATRLTGAKKARVYLKDGVSYRVAAALGMTPDQRAFENTNPIEASNTTWVGRAALDRTVVHISDAEANGQPEMLRFGAVGGVLCVPLIRQGAAIGVVVLARDEPGVFGPRQIDLVKTFADQAVIAIENVSLVDDAERRSGELATALETLRTTRDRLAEMERLAALGQFTAGIMHEVRDPLDFLRDLSAQSNRIINRIRGVLEAAVLDGATRAEVEELADTLADSIKAVADQGRRTVSILDNMLAHGGDHRPVDINTVVDESLGLAYHGARAERHGFKVALEKAFDPKAGAVDLYPKELTRALLNLIANGFNATERRSAEAKGYGYEPVLAASTKNLGDSVEIRIRDNGTGIPAELREKIFDPFFTTRPGEGSGLGLSSSRDIIVNQHAGTIEVETVPGSFTEFRIVLPREAASLAKRGAATDAREETASQPTLSLAAAMPA